MSDVHIAQLPDGRFVKMRELTSADQERAAAASGLTLTKDGLSVADSARLDSECVKLALVAVSAPKARNADPAALAPGDWRPLSYGELETSYDALFGARARVLLLRLYNRVHVPSQEDSDAFFATIQSAAGTS